MSDVVAWLREELDRIEQTAQAAALADGPVWTHNLGDRWLVEGMDGPVIYDEGSPTDEQAQHIALWDPQAVLRRVTADRQLLDDLLSERHTVVEDCWYTCPAATEEHDGGDCCDDDRRGGACNCGRDARVERRVRLLAEGYGWGRHHPGACCQSCWEEAEDGAGVMVDGWCCCRDGRENR
ncbi:DUF6221 family protein [Kitasatospora sp. NPDC101155]|uniref:DUF6221 family protein n=1 Tax=Kitasatospora sp. NPDC101155 TaxID=3364097 RepID=UPI003800F176